MKKGWPIYQAIVTMDQRYQGPITIKKLADYSWSLKRDITDSIYKRNSK